jgi:hypothetical protein
MGQRSVYKRYFNERSFIEAVAEAQAVKIDNPGKRVPYTAIGLRHGKTLANGEFLPIPCSTLSRYVDLAAQNPQQQLKEIVSDTKAGRKRKLQPVHQQHSAPLDAAGAAVRTPSDVGAAAVPPTAVDAHSSETTTGRAAAAGAMVGSSSACAATSTDVEQLKAAAQVHMQALLKLIEQGLPVEALAPLRPLLLLCREQISAQSQQQQT